MKTNEVEKLLGLSKHTIMFYEKEGLLNPSRDQNGYRNYNDCDIETLKLIQSLRGMEFSIDEIKMVFEGQTSIRQILETKKDYIEESQKKIEDAKKRIEEHLQTKRVHIAFDNQIKENTIELQNLFFNDTHIRYMEDIFEYENIQKIQLSMFSEIAMMRGLSVWFHYYIDFDIVTSFDTYSFSIVSYENILKMYDLLCQHHVTIEDPLGIIKLYQDKPDDYARTTYLDHHFKALAKTYHLDNPRGSAVKDHLKRLSGYTKDTKEDSEDMNRIYQDIVENVTEGFSFFKKKSK